MRLDRGCSLTTTTELSDDAKATLRSKPHAGLRWPTIAVALELERAGLASRAGVSWIASGDTRPITLTPEGDLEAERLRREYREGPAQ